MSARFEFNTIDKINEMDFLMSLCLILFVFSAVGTSKRSTGKQIKK